MTREKFMLAAMSAAGTKSFSPVQIQKLFFLLDANISELTDGKRFDFKPYDYGPFDKEVYEELDHSRSQGLVEVSGSGQRSRQYSLTGSGLEEGEQFFEELPAPAREYISKIVEFVRSLSFRELVSTIYAAYPEMKANSVFQKE